MSSTDNYGNSHLRLCGECVPRVMYMYHLYIQINFLMQSHVTGYKKANMYTCSKISFVEAHGYEIKF